MNNVININTNDINTNGLEALIEQDNIGLINDARIALHRGA